MRVTSLACPCHTAFFELDGQAVEGEPSDSPRPMDRLTATIENDTEVWVEFQDFEKGITAQVARS